MVVVVVVGVAVAILVAVTVAVYGSVRDDDSFFWIKIVRGNGQAYSSRTPKKVRADLKKLFWRQKLSFYIQEFQVFVYFRQYWTDKRLAHGTEATLMLGGTDVNRIWLPDTYINNANDHEVFQDNQLVLIDKNGQIVYFAYARIAAACQMKLVKFPMDVQQCHLTLESCKYETKTVGGVAGPTRVISSARSLWSKCLTFSLP